jgi:mannan endo-1,4-beta-mannosidase
MLKFHRYLKRIMAAMAAAVLCSSAYAGFYTDGATLKDGNGNPFVMRGVNVPHAWFSSQTSQSLADISATGANSVRVVLSSGSRWSRTSASDVQSIIDTCKANNLIAVLEVHDTTGYGEQAGAQTLSGAVDYWLDIASVLQGEEDYVIINIGNEPFGNGASASEWINGHANAINRLRSAGLTHTLMVDAPNWGQDWQGLMRANAPAVLSADVDNNVVFSVHMYQVYDTANKVQSYINGFVSDGLPLVVEEFAADHFAEDVAEGAILQTAQNAGVGYLGWSWSGNSSDLASLDIVENFNPSNLTSWGQTLINGANGIAATSATASVYSGGNSNNGGNNNGGNASCGTQDGNPICCDVNSDPDGDGWGWENNQSCVVTNSSNNSNNNPACGTQDGTPICCDANSDPDGDGWGWENEQSCVAVSTGDNSSSGGSCDWHGSIYPVCQNTSSGWGWENDQSCISQMTCDSQ